MGVGTSDTTTATPVQTSATDADNHWKACKALIQLLETYIRDTANVLMDKVNLSADNITQNESDFELVIWNNIRAEPHRRIHLFPQHHTALWLLRLRLIHHR